MKKRTLLTLISIVGALGAPAISALIASSPVSAYSTTDFVLNTSPAPTVSISFGEKVGTSDLSAPTGATDVANYYIPANINVSGITKYFISVYLDCTDSTNVDACNDGKLVDGNNVIPGVSNSKTLDNMSDEWGFRYNIGSTTNKPSGKFFTAMPTTKEAGWIKNDIGGTAFTTNTSRDSKVLTLDFGAAISSSAAAGTYSGKAVVAVVATPAELVLGGVATMQQLNHDICAGAEVHDTAYLKDERDGKYYWVTKLEDQHCWMSQNLDLDVYANTGDGNVYAGTFDKYVGNTGGTLSNTGVKLTKDNTDITTDTLSTTKMPKSTIQNVALTGANVNTGDMSKNSWDQGLYIINDPVAAGTACINNTGIKDCAMFTDVSLINNPNWMASDDPNFTNISNYKHPTTGASLTKTQGSPIDSTNKVYDAHYLIGNYYQFNAATAGSGDGLKDIDAPNSLCPKGWKLPSSGTQEDVSGRGSFYYMLNQYKVAGSLTGTLGGKTTNIALSPLFYVRSGFVNPEQANKLHSTGQYGFGWSARANDTDANKAYYLEFQDGNTNVYPEHNFWRFFGSSIRCVMY